jgi:hypothetical protein
LSLISLRHRKLDIVQSTNDGKNLKAGAPRDLPGHVSAALESLQLHMSFHGGQLVTGALGLFSLAFRHEAVLRCASKGLAI